MKAYVRLVLSFTIVLALVFPAYAAITGVISGTVMDPQGAVVPQVTVIVVNEQTGVQHTTLTDSKGFYSFPVLDVGNYTVTVSQPGFEKFEQVNITVDTNSSVRTDVHLKLGSVTVTEEVQSNAVQVETQSSQLGEVIDSQTMQAVPLNGRSYTDLLSLQPGVSPQSGIESSDTPAPSGGLNSGSVSVNGGRGASNGYMVNGGDTSDGVENTAAIIPNLDSIQEFRIITSNFDAEYGNYSGSQVNVVTKNGTNTWHGSGFEFLRNTVFNAAGYQFATPALPRSSYNQNIYGGTFGGPIKRDKVFFFADFQGTDRSVAATSSTAVPSATDLTGNVSDWATQFTTYGGTVQGTGWAGVLSNRLGYAVTAGEPYYTDAACTTTSTTDPCVFPGLVIPKAAWDPAVPALLKYIQPGNATSSNPHFAGGSAPVYQNNSLNTITDDYKESARVDYNSKYGVLFGYYFVDNTTINNPFGAGSFPGWGTATQQRAQSGNVGLTSTFKNNSVNTFRFTYLRSAVHSGNPTFATPGPSLSSLGFVSPWGPSGGIGNIYGPLAGVPTMSIAEGGSFGTPTEVQGRFVNNFQWLDSYMKVVGLHTFQFGVNYKYDQIDARNYYDVNGGFGFSDSNETGLGFADFLLGAENGGFTQASPQILDSRSNYVSGYAEDAWRAGKSLTVNYGIRYEVTTPWYDTQNKIETIIPGEQSQVFPGAPLGWVFPGDPGVPRTLGPIKYNKFAPRVGFAYSPSAASEGFLSKLTGGPGNFSIRGGFGIFYNNFQDVSGFVEIGDAPYGLYYQASTQTMLSTPYIDRGTQHVELQKFPFAFPPTNVSPKNPDNNINWASYEPLSSDDSVGVWNTVPYVENWMLGFQRGAGRNTVVTVNYVGNGGHHLATSEEANPGNPALCLSLDTAAKVAKGTTPCGPKLESNIFTSATGTVSLGTRILPGQNGNIAFGSNPYLLTSAYSNYNSLQTSLKHSSASWDLLLSFTWSKSLDDSSSLTGSTNVINPRLSYGLSSYDVAKYLVASYEWHLPFARFASNGFVKQVVGGWSISGITRMATGTPIAMSDSEDYSLYGTSIADVPYYNPNAGPLYLNHNPRIRNPASPTQSLPYFNTARFTAEGKECAVKAACYGLRGNSEIRFFHGPGIDTTDLAILRDFHIHAEHVVQFRLEAFDFLNHAMFSAPSGSVTSSTFGIITSASTGLGGSGSPFYRILQVAVKYHF
jgi:hypothetical protein